MTSKFILICIFLLLIAIALGVAYLIYRLNKIHPPVTLEKIHDFQRVAKAQSMQDHQEIASSIDKKGTV